MSIDLKALGAFTTDELIPQTVKFGDKEATVYVRLLPSVEIDRFVEESRDPDINIRINAIPRLLSKSIRDEDGKAIFTVDAARMLKPFARKALMKAFDEVNAKRDDDAGNA